MRRWLGQKHVLFIAVALLLFLLAALTPGIAVRQIDHLSDHDVRSADATALVFDAAPCEPQSGEPARVCQVREENLRQELEVRVSETGEKDLMEIHASERLVAGEREILKLNDSLRVIEHSTYPVVDPVSRIEITAPSWGISVSENDAVRGGLQYFFPFPSERRSYSIFDPIADASFPADYADTSEGVNRYVQEIPVTPVRPDDPSLGVTGNTSDFYSDKEENLPLGEVRLRPYYTAQRTLWVEPKSGTILNEETSLHLFLARNDAEAATPPTDSQRARTLLKAQLSWDDKTRARAEEDSDHALGLLLASRVAAFLLQLVGLVLLVLGVLRFNRVRA